MRILKVYIPLDEFSDYIKKRLPDSEATEDCTLVPLQIRFNETEMSIESLMVAAKDGLPDNKRHRTSEASQEQYEQLTIDFGDEV